MFCCICSACPLYAEYDPANPEVPLQDKIAASSTIGGENSVLKGALVRVLLNGRYSLRFIVDTLVDEHGCLFLRLQGISMPVHAEHISNRDPFSTNPNLFYLNRSVLDHLEPLEVQELAARSEFMMDALPQAFPSLTILDHESIASISWRLRLSKACFKKLMCLYPNMIENGQSVAGCIPPEAQQQFRTIMLNLMTNRWGRQFCADALEKMPNSSQVHNNTVLGSKFMARWQSILMEDNSMGELAFCQKTEHASETCPPKSQDTPSQSEAISLPEQLKAHRSRSCKNSNLGLSTGAWGIGIQRSISPPVDRNTAPRTTSQGICRTRYQETPSLAALLISPFNNLSMEK